MNFWRPTDLRKPRLEPGTPFLFKLREDFGGMIVGFGIFAGHVVQPMWLAWEEFGTKNGAPTFVDFLRNLERILLAEPRSFPSETAVRVQEQHPASPYPSTALSARSESPRGTSPRA